MHTAWVGTSAAGVCLREGQAGGSRDLRREGCGDLWLTRPPPGSEAPLPNPLEQHRRGWHQSVCVGHLEPGLGWPATIRSPV